MLAKNLALFGIVAIAVVSIGGISLLTNNVTSLNDSVNDGIRESTEQRFSSVYPMPPPLPAQKILSNSIGFDEVQKNAGFELLEPTLPKGFVLLSSTYNPIYDEATFYYGPQSLLSKINDSLTMDDLLGLGVIIIDYERRANMDNISNEITRLSQSENGTYLNVNGKQGYSIIDDFVNRHMAVLFDEETGMRITVVYNKGTISQVENIAKSLYSGN